jgi:hypothetical protein
MFLQLLVSFVSSETAKLLIQYAIKKLLDHEEDGVTKDVAKIMLDGIVQSDMNPIVGSTLGTAYKMLKQDTITKKNEGV